MLNQLPNACLSTANRNAQISMENASLNVMAIIGYQRSASCSALPSLLVTLFRLHVNCKVSVALALVLVTKSEPFAALPTSQWRVNVR